MLNFAGTSVILFDDFGEEGFRMTGRALQGAEPWRVAWRYQPGGVIWSIHPAGRGKIVGEERDVARKATRFFCIELRGGRIQWDKKSFEEPWWVGIEAVHRDVMFLHGFVTPELPVHRGVTAVDLVTGRKLWSHATFTFACPGEHGVVVKQEAYDGDGLLEVDLRTGSVLGTPSSPPEVKPPLSDDAFVIPVPLQETGSVADLPVRGIRRFLQDKEVAGEPEAVLLGEAVVFSYYEYAPRAAGTGDGLRHRLAAIDRASGTVVYDDVLDETRSTIVPDSFFIAENMLCYVRERTQLTAVGPLPATSLILRGRRP